jgi:hypothetical protein
MSDHCENEEFCKDHTSMMKISQDLQEVKAALLGNYEKKGWVTRVAECESEMKKIRQELSWAKAALWSTAGFMATGVFVFCWQLLSGSVQIITK